LLFQFFKKFKITFAQPLDAMDDRSKRVYYIAAGFMPQGESRAFDNQSA
jgi:hypothetical protein